MMKKRFIVLFLLYQAFGLPLTVNFQMVVKDDSGKPVLFNNENLTFSMSGDMGISFWSETKRFTSPNGILNTKLGDASAIDPVSFYAQNSMKLTVTRANNDTLLSEPFNTVPFAFKAGFADSSRNAYALQGKAPADFLAASFEATVKQMISDTVAAHPAVNPAAQIADTAASLRYFAVNQDSLLKSGVRLDIRDSINGRFSNSIGINCAENPGIALQIKYKKNQDQAIYIENSANGISINCTTGVALNTNSLYGTSVYSTSGPMATAIYGENIGWGYAGKFRGLVYVDGALSIQGTLNLYPTTSSSTDSTKAILFLDRNDGGLKIRFPNGNIKIISTNQ